MLPSFSNVYLGFMGQVSIAS